MKNKFDKNRKAFSLLELSILIIVIAVIATGVLLNSVASVNSDKIKITNERIQKIYQALGNYLLVHGKLPCPAPINAIKLTSSSYGVAATEDGNCATTDGVYQSDVSGAENLVYGMIPVKTLGLDSDFAEDGYESKFDYIIDKRFTNSSTFSTANVNNSISLSNSSCSMIKVTFREAILSDEYQNSCDDRAFFAIISHGSNKLGAFNANSATINSASTNQDEIDNSATNFTDAATNSATFSITKRLEASNTTNSGTKTYFNAIDDVVFFKSRDNMIKDFNAFSKIDCLANGYNSDDVVYGGTTMTWPQAKYGQIAVATNSCPTGYKGGVTKPTKKCGPLGIWQSGVVTTCNAG
ncbi:MAG: hypothetical protein FJ368_04805 [Pelagibacterales bacterium]|nr:hypothetical protein [Pelagibacterales bacterium]